MEEKKKKTTKRVSTPKVYVDRRITTKSGGGHLGNKNAVGNKGGAPQKYSDEWITNEAKLFREWMNKPDSLFFTTFATERGYCIQRLTEFADKSAEFSEVLKFAKDWQQNRLVNGGLKNETNSQMTRFVLANHHGYYERPQPVEETSKTPPTIIINKIEK